MDIADPTNVVAPAYLGAMWFDAASNVFYQARGLTAADWVFVPPADMVGSFVKIYDQFYGLPEDDPKDASARQRYLDAQIVRDTMAMSGVEVVGLGGLRWRAANGIDVFQIRLRFRKIDSFVLFAGFAEEPKAHAMPSGVGFEMSNGFLRFGGNAREIAEGETFVLRIEVSRGYVFAYVGDELLDSHKIEVIPSVPVVALFDIGPGPRPVAPGYDRMLERKMPS
jgi:hypothetical protein